MVKTTLWLDNDNSVIVMVKTTLWLDYDSSLIDDSENYSMAGL